MLSPWCGCDSGVHGGNGVGWFVGALFFCYLAAPFLPIIFKKFNQYKYSKWIYLFFIWLIAMIIVILFAKKYAVFLYYFPLIRLFQFVIGYILGMCYKEYNLSSIFNKFIQNNKYKSIFDILFVLIIFVLIYVVGSSSWHTTIIIDYLLYIPLICLFILYLCVNFNSIIDKFLNSKFSMFLAGISMEAFLIHYIFIQFTSKFMVVNTKSETAIMFAFLLGLTILCSIGYKNLQNKIETIIKRK